MYFQQDSHLYQKKITKRMLTKRAVLWLGQTCNLRCYFCYFLDRIQDSRHPEHAFMSLEKAKKICHVFRNFYGCHSIDIQGGEPTLYPPILELISYCRKIGLLPTLITNGLVLAKEGELEKYRESGIGDFILSLHGLGDIHDEVVGKKGAYDLLDKTIERMRKLRMSFRFNCVLTKKVIDILPSIAQKAIDDGALVVNFLAFNPFNDQQKGKRSDDNVPMYTYMKPKISTALDMLEEAGIEANVRYLPLCMAEPRHRKNFYNWQQLSYDSHEWDLQSWFWSDQKPQRKKEGDVSVPIKLGFLNRQFHGLLQRANDKKELRAVLSALQRLVVKIAVSVKGYESLVRKEAMLKARQENGYQYHAGCKMCSVRNICDGFHRDYVLLFGKQEAEPIRDIHRIRDPKYFINEQAKIIEQAVPLPA